MLHTRKQHCNEMLQNKWELLHKIHQDIWHTKLLEKLLHSKLGCLAHTKWSIPTKLDTKWVLYIANKVWNPYCKTSLQICWKDPYTLNWLVSWCTACTVKVLWFYCGLKQEMMSKIWGSHAVFEGEGGGGGGLSFWKPWTPRFQGFIEKWIMQLRSLKMCEFSLLLDWQANTSLTLWISSYIASSWTKRCIFNGNASASEVWSEECVVIACELQMTWVISQNWSLNFQKMALKACERCVNSRSRMTFFKDPCRCHVGPL